VSSLDASAETSDGLELLQAAKATMQAAMNKRFFMMNVDFK
jgi:hypothetical protein